MAFGADTSFSRGSLTGLWNDAAEPGWGAAIIHQYAMIFATVYTYDNAGNATWYVASACPVSGNGCSGPLYSVAGGTNPTSAWGSPNTKVTQVGAITFSFGDANTGSISFSINGSNGVKAIVRDVFATTPPSTAQTTSATGYVPDTASSDGVLSGLWNNPNEPGWGSAITQQYGMIFATFYTYDDLGKPTWYVASACPVAGSGCAGPLYAVSGGTNPVSPWGAPSTKVTQVGMITYSFSDANTGAMSYSINGLTATKAISRYVFASAPATLIGFYGARYTQVAETAGFTNFLWESLWFGEDEALATIGAAKKPTVLDVSNYLFVGSGTRHTLAPNAESKLLALRDRLVAKNLMPYVQYLYTIDEPDLSVATDADLAGANQIARKVFPSAKLVVIYAGITRLSRIADYDLVGFDDYDQGDNIFNRTFFPFPPQSDYQRLLDRMSPGQKVILVPGGGDPWRQDPAAFFSKAASDTRVGMIASFLWIDTTNPDGSILPGIRNNGMARTYCAAAVGMLRNSYVC
jgi:hypothetical protein